MQTRHTRLHVPATQHGIRIRVRVRVRIRVRVRVHRVVNDRRHPERLHIPTANTREAQDSQGGGAVAGGMHRVVLSLTLSLSLYIYI